MIQWATWLTKYHPCTKKVSNSAIKMNHRKNRNFIGKNEVQAGTATFNFAKGFSFAFTVNTQLYP